MKIPLRHLDGNLKGSIAGAYLVAGPEPLLVDEALGKIRSAAAARGFESRELHTVDRGFRWAELAASADNLSLFAARKIVELRLSSPRLGDEGGSALRGLIEKPDPDRLLLIALSERLDQAAQKTVWVKSIEQHGVWVDVWPIERGELPAWIGERARALNLRLTQDATLALAERVEGNLLAADQELKKLALAGLEGELDETRVLAAVSNSARYDVFALANAITAGDARRALNVLDGLEAEGVEPVLISWALTRELTLLSRLKHAAERGIALEGVLARERIPPRRQGALKVAVRRFRRHDLDALLAQAAEVDAAIKGAAEMPPWEAITGLVLEALRAGAVAARRRA